MGLHDEMVREPVSRLALREPVMVSPDTSVRDAVTRMRTAKLGCAVVVDAQQRPQGMFTESMLRQLLAEQPGALDDSVQDHMAAQWPWVGIDDPITDVLEAMQAKNVRFLCVVDGDGKLMALTGQKGLMEYIAEFFPHQVMVQRVGCEPTIHEREGA